jgi:hypothetical protein
MDLNRFVRAVMAVSFLFVAPACATSTAGDLPCESDEDCPVGTVCDLEQNQCVRVSISSNSDTSDAGNDDNSNPFNAASNNPLNGVTRDMGSDDTGQGVDMGNPCDPACEDDQVCDRGTCVSACDPACEAPATCTANGCEIPDCSEVGGPCDVNDPDQGEFTCVDSGDGVGICLTTCGTMYTADECPSGQYCWSFDDAPVCIPRTCDTHSDCDTGSCVEFDNDFGICFQAGALAEGETCDPDDTQCEEGTLCRSTGGGSGVCSRICDQWAADPGCPNGEYCAAQVTPRTALCTDDTDPMAPLDPFMACSDPATACGDGVRCFDLGSQDGCLQYCRPGESDCDGLTDGSGNATVCDNYAFGGQRAVGICWPACDPGAADPCGPGAVCDNLICRTNCTAGNEVDDCCNGNNDCPFTCNDDGLCE